MKNDLVFWIVSLGTLIALLFLIRSCEVSQCETSCAPNMGKVQYRTSSCYCKVNGKWEIKDI